MTGLLGGWGLGVERLVAADRMFSSFSILSILRLEDKNLALY